MRKTLTALVAAVTFGGAVAATAVPAQARPHDRSYYRHYKKDNDAGVAIAAGVVGLALGAALASSSGSKRGYYDRGYYGDRYYGGSYGRGYYGTPYYGGSYGRGYYNDRYYGGSYGRGYYNDRYYGSGYGRGYYDGRRVCTSKRWVWDDYSGRRVQVKQRYAC